MRKSKKLNDKIVVVDLEATCWNGRPPLGQKSDIIEIGVCLLDVTTGERSKKRGIIVKPARSKVSKFCEELTSLTHDEVEEGVSLKEAFRELSVEYQTKNRIWASYGEYDRSMVAEQASDFGLEYPFGARHLNVKTLHALHFNLQKECGLARAVNNLGLKMEGRHHRGHDDAWNTASVLWHAMKGWRQK